MQKEVIKGYKFRIYPTKLQEKAIEDTFKACAYVYNGMLSLREFRYKEFGEKLTNFDLSKILTQVKKGDDWLKKYDSHSLAFAIRDMDRAYEVWIKQLSREGVKYSAKTLQRCARKGIEPKIWMAQNYPSSKSKNNPNTSYTTRQIRIKDKKINLPKIGKVKINTYDSKFDNFYIESECTVSKSSTGKYYVSILVKEWIEMFDYVEGKIGIDLGLKTFAYTSENQQFELPKKIWAIESRIKFLQKKMSKQIRGSERYEKTRILIAKHHERIVNIRKNFQHEVSTQLIKENKVIAIEDLSIKGMLKNKRISNAVSKSSFYQFRTMLESKGKWHERQVSVISRWYPSSKTCSACGHVKEKLPTNIRTYKCEKCGVEIDRDYNASINILRNGTELATEKETKKRLDLISKMKLIEIK